MVCLHSMRTEMADISRVSWTIESPPDLSVITATIPYRSPEYDRRQYLRESVWSVLSQQGGLDIEHIVVNNGCDTDEAQATLEEVAGWSDKVRVVTLGRERTIGQALNVGFYRSSEGFTGNQERRSPFIWQIDDDDRMHPRGAERQLAAFDAHVGAAAVFGATELIDTNGNSGARDPDIDYLNIHYSSDLADFLCTMWESNEIINGSICMRRSAVESMMHCYYDEWALEDATSGIRNWLQKGDISGAEGVMSELGPWNTKLTSVDWDLWLRLMIEGGYIVRHDETVNSYRIHPGQWSNQCKQDDTWQRDTEDIRQRLMRRATDRVRYERYERAGSVA